MTHGGFSQIAFGFSIILFWGDLKEPTGLDSGIWFWGTMLYLAVLLTVLGKAALVSECVLNHHVTSLLLMVLNSQYMDEVHCCRYGHSYISASKKKAHQTRS
jgi:hypothetical protein